MSEPYLNGVTKPEIHFYTPVGDGDIDETPIQRINGEYLCFFV